MALSGFSLSNYRQISRATTSNKWSFAVWCYPTATGPDYMNALHNFDESAVVGILKRAGFGTWTADYTSSSSNWDRDSGLTIETNKWQLLVATVDASTNPHSFVLYKCADGSISSDSWTTAAAALSRTLTNWRQNTPTFDRSFVGRIALAGVWDMVLSSTDVASLYNSGDGVDFADVQTANCRISNYYDDRELGIDGATDGSSTHSTTGSLTTVAGPFPPTYHWLVPDANITQTSFTNGFAQIDELTASDADFAYGANNTAAVLEVGLSDPTETINYVGATIHYRIAKTNAGTVDGGGNAVTVTCQVYEGATLRATDTARTATGTWTQYDWTPDLSAVTDWTDVRLRFTTSASGGSPANRRGGAVSWGVAVIESQASVPVQLTGSVGDGSAEGLAGSAAAGGMWSGSIGAAESAGLAGSAAVGGTWAGSIGDGEATGLAGTVFTGGAGFTGVGLIGTGEAVGLSGAATLGATFAGSIGSAEAVGLAGSATLGSTYAGTVGAGEAVGLAGSASIGGALSGQIGDCAAAGLAGAGAFGTLLAGAAGEGSALGLAGGAAIGALWAAIVGEGAAEGLAGEIVTATQSPPTVPGAEWRAVGIRMHYTAGAERMQYRAESRRMQWETQET